MHYDWSTVGGPSSGLTTVGSGTSLTLSVAGEILDHVRSTVRTIAEATGTGATNCVIDDTFRADGDNLLLSHCSVAQGVSGAGSYTVQYNFITSDADGMDPTGPGQKLIQYNKIWRDGSRVGENHQDGIQFWQGGNTVISRNYITGWQTSAINLKANIGAISNVTIDSNYLGNPTGYYQLYLCPDIHGITNVTVTNNAFAKANYVVSTCGTKITFVHSEAQRQAAIAAGNQAAANWVVWNNNYVAGTNTVVTPPGGWVE